MSTTVNHSQCGQQSIMPMDLPVVHARTRTDPRLLAPRPAVMRERDPTGAVRPAAKAQGGRTSEGRYAPDFSGTAAPSGTKEPGGNTANAQTKAQTLLGRAWAACSSLRGKSVCWVKKLVDTNAGSRSVGTSENLAPYRSAWLRFEWGRVHAC